MTGEAVELRAALDLRYIGQWHELTVPVELPLDVDGRREAAFHAEHDRLLRPRVARRADRGAGAAR